MFSPLLEPAPCLQGVPEYKSSLALLTLQTEFHYLVYIFLLPFLVPGLWSEDYHPVLR